MDNLVIKKNNEVDYNLLDEVLKFDRTIFPEDEEYSFPDDYFKNLYKNNKDGMFVLLDNNIVIGYVNLIFITDENRDEFLRTRQYLNLEHIGLKQGENNLYLYNLLIEENYRDGQAIKMIMKEICLWLDSEIKEGKSFKYCFSEAVTEDGIKTLNAMNMKAQDVDENGMGIYYSEDNLNKYISNMLNNN